MRRVGKWMAEATCPLCFNIYLLDYNELYKDKEKGKLYFHCPNCDRYVYLQVGECSYITDVKVKPIKKGEE